MLAAVVVVMVVDVVVMMGKHLQSCVGSSSVQCVEKIEYYINYSHLATPQPPQVSIGVPESLTCQLRDIRHTFSSLETHTHTRSQHE
jgi:hypothetical protein